MGKENEVFKIRIKEFEERVFGESIDYIEKITAKKPNNIFKNGSYLENFPNYNKYLGE